MLHPLLARLVFFFSQTPQTPFASNAFCLKASSRPASSSAPCLLSFSLRPISLSCWPLVADHMHAYARPVFSGRPCFATHEKRTSNARGRRDTSLRRKTGSPSHPRLPLTALSVAVSLSALLLLRRRRRSSPPARHTYASFRHEGLCGAPSFRLLLLLFRLLLLSWLFSLLAAR